MDYIIREMREDEYPLLKDFLYEAIFQRDENNLLPKEIIEMPEIRIYIEDFGKKKDDYCLCAVVEDKVVGAVWVRIIEGFGCVDSQTPELAIALYKEYRRMGIGRKLMEEMLNLLKEKGYRKTSLSVQKDNYAAEMYLKMGYMVTEDKGEEYIMEYVLR